MGKYVLRANVTTRCRQCRPKVAAWSIVMTSEANSDGFPAVATRSRVCILASLHTCWVVTKDARASFETHHCRSDITSIKYMHYTNGYERSLAASSFSPYDFQQHASKHKISNINKRKASTHASKAGAVSLESLAQLGGVGGNDASRSHPGMPSLSHLGRQVAATCRHAFRADRGVAAVSLQLQQAMRISKACQKAKVIDARRVELSLVAEPSKRLPLCGHPSHPARCAQTDPAPSCSQAP